jgi:hypothetical protein
MHLNKLNHKIVLALATWILTLLVTLLRPPSPALAQTGECQATATSSHTGEQATTASLTVDGATTTYFNSSYSNWQHIQIDLGCVSVVTGLRRYMTTNGSTTTGRRLNQGESVSYSRDGQRWSELTRTTSNGWESYVNYGARQHAWHSVSYGWSAWLNLNTPAEARYIRFIWDDNFDALNEIEVRTGDHQQLAWAQDYTTGSRRVLLRWYGATPSDAFVVYRRPQGATPWQAIATVTFAADAQAMSAILGPNLLAQLALDLRRGPNGEPTDQGPALTTDQVYQALRQDTLRAMLLADQNYEVALALGVGYLDLSAPANQTLEYYVARQGSTTPHHGPVGIAANPAPYPTPVNVRESSLFHNLPDLGLRPSARPLNAPERHDWDRYQVLQHADGKALIHWDKPNTGSTGRPTHYTAGYRLYRRGPAVGNSWQMVNAQAPHQVRPQLISPHQPDLATQNPVFPDDATFEDNLKALFTSAAPADLYANWNYRVCNTDLLGNEQSCSPDVNIPVRELGSPAPPNGLSIAVAPDHSVLTLTVAYSNSHEVSAPLRLFVTRSPSATLPSAQWSELTPNGLLVNSANPTVTVQINDAPPIGRPFWYRVQVRDNAGNWSAAGGMVNGGRYPRQAPPLGDIPYDPQQCANNPLPLVINNLNPAFQQLVVYRSFAASDRGQIIKRVLVQNGSATITDELLPPYATTVYYRIEAIDSYGNASNLEEYCSELGPRSAPPDPSLRIAMRQTEGATTLYTLETGHPDGATPGGDAGEEQVITVVRPGEGGNSTSQIGNNNTQFDLALTEGETVQVTVQNQNEFGASPGRSLLLRQTNNFLNTNRQMTRITAPIGVEWASGLPNPSVRIHFPNRFPDNPGPREPVVALFRQAGNGNWLQVTTMQGLGGQAGQFNFGSGLQRTWVVMDNSDPSANQEYRYLALAFSPTSYEILGYWEPVKLAPLVNGPDALRVTPMLGLAPTFPQRCSFTNTPPSSFDRILLYNGWLVKLEAVRQYTSCQDPSYNPNGFYGTGFLSDGNQSWPLELINLSLASTSEPGLMEHTGGRILLDGAGLNLDVADPNRLPAHIGRIEFLPGQANAEVVLTLPANLQLVDPQRVEHSSRMMAVFANLDPTLKFDPVEIAAGGVCANNNPTLHLVDENLPWRLHPDKGMTLSADALTLNSQVCTSDRLGYPQPAINHPATPDNNLAYLRARYLSDNVVVTSAGLQGSFATDESIHYATSLPAAVVIQATGGKVEIAASQVQSGQLFNAQAELTYFQDGVDLTYIRANGYLFNGHWQDDDDPTVIPGSALCRWQNMLRDATLTIGAGGTLLGAVRLQASQVGACKWPVDWAGFDLFDPQNPFVEGQLFTAAASVMDTSVSGAPAPAENGWRQLPEATTDGDLDPGVNLNLRTADAYFACYPGVEFGDLDLDLYVRRGGVSENLIINPGVDGDLNNLVNQYGYSETLLRYNVVFVDNLIIPDPAPDVQMDLFLPYPSQVSVPLQASEFTAQGCPDGGAVREPLPTLQHKYWDFRTLPAAWAYVTTQREPYSSQLAQGGNLPAQILRLSGYGLVNGLGVSAGSLNQTRDFARVPLDSEWLPNGDYGDIQVTGNGAVGAPAGYYRVSGLPYALSDVKLSHYYSRLGDATSLPDPLGLELDVSLLTLPSELLDGAGNLTPASLKACSQGNTVGCGFVLVDGNGAVEYFGEVQRSASATVQAAGLTSTPGTFLGDAALGLWPVATNNRTVRQVQALVERPSIHWVWPVVNKLVDFDIPVKFLANSAGGALVGVLRNAPFFPGEIASIPLEVLRMDIAAVATAHFPAGLNSFQSEFGVFVGYGASQAALRALAMNRPNEDGTPGVQPFDQWLDVRDDVLTWTQKFGYPINPGSKDDPADLAQDTWNEWSNPARDNDRMRRINSFDKTYNILYAHFEPKLLDNDRPLHTYGITPLRSGRLLNCAGAAINHGMGQATFFATGQDFHVESLQLGIQLDVYTIKLDCGPTPRPRDEAKLLHADWLNMRYNRDDEFIIRGDNIDVNIIDYLAIEDVDILFLIGTQDGFGRVEGSIRAPSVYVPGVDQILTARLQPAAGVFGSGEINGQEFHYLGFRGTAYAGGFGLGGALLFGRIDPQSIVLTQSDFAFLMEKFGTDSGNTLYDGYYVMLQGAAPVFSEFGFPLGCILEVGLAGEMRVWHWKPVTGGAPPIWGGRLSLGGFGTLLCILHQRIQLGVTLEHVNQGWSHVSGATCNASEGCFVATGDIWMVDGIGFCDPESWDNWETRWWDDGWCWQFGAQAVIFYLKPGPIGLSVSGGSSLTLHIEVDFELLPSFSFSLSFGRSAAPIGIPSEPPPAEEPTKTVLTLFLPVVQR